MANLTPSQIEEHKDILTMLCQPSDNPLTPLQLLIKYFEELIKAQAQQASANTVSKKF